MATLRQDHRAGPRGVSPAPAHVAVGEVPVDEVLSPVDGDDVAETARRDDLANREEERRITQHVGDLEQPPLRLRRARDLEALGRRWRDWLFEQDVVTGSKESERARAVLALERRVDQRGRERRPAGDLLPRAELALGGYAVRVCEPRATRIVGLHDRDELR